MASYRLTPQAEEDLYRIWLRGLEEFGEAQADVYYANFFTRFEQLVKTPYLYPAVDDIRQGYRRSVCGVDSIYYRVVGVDVEIMRIVRHQNTKSLFA